MTFIHLKYFLLILAQLKPIYSLINSNEANRERSPLVKRYEVPYVPEEFKSSPKRIIFDENDFVR